MHLQGLWRASTLKHILVFWAFLDVFRILGAWNAVSTCLPLLCLLVLIATGYANWGLWDSRSSMVPQAGKSYVEKELTGEVQNEHSYSLPHHKHSWMSALNEQLPEFSPYVFRNHTMCSLPVFTSSYSSSQFFQLPGAAETGDRATAGESSHRPESQAFGQAICFSSVYIYIYWTTPIYLFCIL